MSDGRPLVTELFAGAGLLSLAFSQVGFRVTRAIELDRIAANTYHRNLGDHIEVGDVTKARPRGKCDVLIAGPPCQGFSTLNRSRRDDPRNALSLIVAAWARQLKPRVVVIENVAAFLDSAVHATVTRQLERMGYSTLCFVANAFDYGCPQMRQRSFTVAYRTRIAPSVPARRRNLRTVREAWDGLPAVPDGKIGHIAPAPSPLALRRMKLIPEGGDKRDVMRKSPKSVPPSWWNVSGEVTDAWGRMRWDEPCNTLRTCLQNPSKGRYIHPDQHRVISLREAARLHTIPDSFQFEGVPTQVARQIGNSVPPSLGRAVARMIMRSL